MDKEYPKWMYGPGGKAQIFERDQVVPKGWQDHPDKVKAPSKPKKPGKPGKGEQEGDEISPEEKAETIAQLREAGVEISDDATVDEINAAIDELTKQQES